MNSRNELRTGQIVKFSGLATALAAALLLLDVGLAAANDAAWGGTPAGLVPLQQNQVRMLSEDIVMTARGERWDVTATYRFQNDDAADTSLNVGFPELHCDPDDSGCHDPAFINLKTWVDGKPVKHRKGKLAEQHQWSKDLGIIWLFDVTFPAGKAVTIKHTYSVVGGEYSSGSRFIKYLVRTGIVWKGTIGHAKFTARFPPYTHTVYKLPVAGLNANPPTVASDERVELVLEGKDWTPTEDVRFMFHAGQRGANHPMALDCFSGASELEGEAVRECRNLLYATKGYRFKSKQLMEQFYAAGGAFRDLPQHFGEPAWGRGPVPLRGFTNAWFDREDRRLLKLFDRLASSDAAEVAPLEPSAGETAEPPPKSAPSVDSASAAPARSAAPAPASAQPRASAEPATGAPPPSAAAPGTSAGAATAPGDKCSSAAVGGQRHRPLPVLTGLLALAILSVRRPRRDAC